MEAGGRSTLQENFAKITGSGLDPGALADELYQRRLINQALAEEASSQYIPRSRRLHAILMAVMGNGHPQSFWGFVESVNKDPSCGWLTQDLIASYQRITGIRDVPQSLRSGPAIVPKPTLRDLITLPGFDWLHVGLELELSDGDLDVITKNYPQDEVKAQREFYRLWLKRCPDATFQQLADALSRAGEANVADYICRKYDLTLSSPMETPQSHVPPPKVKSNPTAGDRPTIAQLQRFGPKKINVPERIGVNYQTFGYFILSDETGSRVSAIMAQCFHHPTNACTEILSQWLQGNGVQERTWGKLVETLHDIDLNTLADDIESGLG